MGLLEWPSKIQEKFIIKLYSLNRGTRVKIQKEAQTNKNKTKNQTKPQPHNKQTDHTTPI